MKMFFASVFAIIYSLTVNAQDLPRIIKDQPDGITFYYFDSKSDACLPLLFIGDSLQILFPCYSKKNYERKDIATADREIKRLRELLTFRLISEIKQCCTQQRCPDTSKGYYMMVKSRGDMEFQYLDLNYASPETCGSKELEEIIDLLNKLNKQYR